MTGEPWLPADYRDDFVPADGRISRLEDATPDGRWWVYVVYPDGNPVAVEPHAKLGKAFDHVHREQARASKLNEHWFVVDGEQGDSRVSEDDVCPDCRGFWLDGILSCPECGLTIEAIAERYAT